MGGKERDYQGMAAEGNYIFFGTRIEEIKMELIQQVMRAKMRYNNDDIRHNDLLFNSANIMRIFALLLYYLFILILLAATTIYFLFSTYYHTSLNYQGPITIERDSFAIPTLHVSTIQQYLYALGTVTAEDRLFQITFRSYAAQGRLSQFLGERALQFDRFMRQVNLRGWAQERAARCRAENITQYARMEVLAQGINDRVAGMIVLPLQFYLTGVRWENFTVNHIFYLYLQFEWAISMNMVDEYTRSALLSNHSQQEIDWILPNKRENWAFKSIPIVSDEEIPDRLRRQNMKEHLQKVKFNPLSVDRLFELEIIESLKVLSSIDATNCWAVSGEHTESGLPLLSNDPHLESIVPSQWYPFRINFTGEGRTILAAGGNNPGSPHFYGKTPYYGVGFSVSHTDNQDLFRETVEDGKYLVNGKWRNLKIRNETILVQTATGLREDFYEIRQTHRGPIIHYIFGALGSYSLENDTLSLAWTGFNSEWKSFLNLTYAFLIDDLQEMRAVLQNGTSTFINANIMVVTADNHIIMQQTGIHPIRRNVDSGIYIKDGSTTDHDWVGIVPSQDRMHIMDPRKGYIVKANNRVAQSAYYDGYLDRTIYTARADRLDYLIRQQILSGRKISASFAKKILLDTVDVYCQQILPQIRSILRQAEEVLGDFDCDFRKESHQATVYEVFMFELYHLIKPMSPKNMSLISFHHMQQGIFNYIHFAFRGDSNKQSIIVKAWEECIYRLQTHFQTDNMVRWVWGQFHLDTNRHVPFRSHPLLSRLFNLQFAGSGNFHTPNVAKMEQLEFGNFETTHRANSRVVYGFGENENWFVVDSGVSENILSRHYSDQWELLSRGEMMPLFPEHWTFGEQL